MQLKLAHNTAHQLRNTTLFVKNTKKLIKRGVRWLNNANYHDLVASRNIVRKIKSVTLHLVGHVDGVKETKNTYGILGDLFGVTQKFTAGFDPPVNCNSLYSYLAYV